MGVAILVAVHLVLVVIVVVALVRMDGGALSPVALSVGIELIGLGVDRQLVLASALGGVATEDAVEEAALGSVARGVVVVGAGTEALLLAVVTDQGDFHEHGEDEEEAIERC